MRPLTRETTPPAALIGASAPLETGIVHLGLGNFHRAHAAVYTAQALAAEFGDWGIAGFANASRRVVDPLTAQDHRYSILQLSENGAQAGVVDVHRSAAVLADDRSAFIAALVRPQHRILTLTISETGYSRSSRTGRLDLDEPAITADLADPQHPVSAVGLMALGLARRAEHGEPFTVLSCDNLQSAGHATRAVVTEFLEASGADADVLSYVESRVAFPNAMVDRIVPATTPATTDEVAALLGVIDACPVRAEDFSMWVLEDEFAGGRPAWDRAGAIMSDEVERYEVVKLRLLNGSHSLIAYLGGLDGQSTIPDAWRQPFIRDAVLAGIRTDYLPSIALPQGLDVDAYVESLTHRWANSALGDRTARVGSDGSTKLLQRIPAPAEHALRSGRVPHQLALTTAAWICAIAPPAGFTPGPIADEMQDAARHRMVEATRGAQGPRAHAIAVLNAGFLPDSLTAHAAFVDRVAELVDVIVRHGVRAAASDALRSSTSGSTVREEVR
ncbi:mannitol dehydrogenase family protein [Microbacterium sp. P01]|uniref:mannitol dehydrogenase family protein n=1 Tax=Microbacterium sp. P01 TaxID=3366261 RepID=UPI003670CCB4